MYGRGNRSDALGYSKINIGNGIHQDQTDFEGPHVKLSLNDSLFVSGSITDNAPTLYATITDKSGINLTDENIGHSMRLKLDEQEEIIVSNHYRPISPNANKGQIKYTFQNLKKETIKLHSECGMYITTTPRVLLNSK